ncbi:MAG TPA: hypothetical protein VLX29_08830 [Nitrospirota bacterium]|nr:hypothetical protein [Nitrospirota bacterium]
MQSDKYSSDPVTERFQETLDRPIAFHPVFVDVTGSITAGLLLSQAVYWTKRVSQGDWFYKTMKQWKEETRLSRHEQENARKILRQFSFWHEERRGVPAKMYFRVDIPALYNELLHVKAKERALVRFPESRKLDFRKAVSKEDEIGQAGTPKTGNLYKGTSETTPETTSKTTTNTLHPPANASPANPVSRRLIENLLSGTMIHDADAKRITQAARQYNRSKGEIEVAIDVLNDQYRQSTKPIKDPTALLVSILRDGVSVHEGLTLLRPHHRVGVD